MAIALFCAVSPLRGQVSLTSAIDMAIRNSPRVKSSQADVEKARAILGESKDVYIPSLTAGSALGQAYGYSPYPPTLFTLTSSSLVYNASQFSYIHAAGAGVDAALQALADMRENVAEEAALAFIAVDHDQQREDVLRQQSTYSARLLQIVQDRFDAGQDSRLDLTNAKLADARLRLALLRAADDTATDRERLARLIGIPPNSLRAEGGFPSAPIAETQPGTSGPYANAAVASAFANAKAKRFQAHGDANFLYRPQVSFVAQYNRYATFTNAFKNLQTSYSGGLAANDEAFGVKIDIPILDRMRRSKATESLADANKALHDAEFAQMGALDAQSRLSHNIETLKAQAEVAALDQDVAQQQLEIVQLQLQSANASPQPMTPKDEQNSRIAEREKYLAVIDNAFQLHQAEVSLLRQTGQLEQWILLAGLNANPQLPVAPKPQP
jgi:outer membrane protein TolC